MGTPTTAGIRIPRIYLCGNNNCRLEFIKKLVSLGIGEESVWELYPLDQLKKEYAIIKKLK